MRKTTALLSATTLGVVAAATGGAAAASADIITDPRCEDFGDHFDSFIEDALPDWYMECVPQYGIGKAEMVLDAPDAGFPEDFDVTLVTRTDTTDASGVAPYYEEYFGEGSTLTSWITPMDVDLDGSTPTSLRVGAIVVAPVASVGRLDEVPAAVAAECDVDGEFSAADEVIPFVSYYAPVSTTLSYVGADGVTYSAPITVTPDPTYYLVMSDVVDEETVITTICVTDTHQTVVGPVEGLDEVFVSMITLPPYQWLEDLDEEFGDLPQLGTFAFAAPAAPAAQPEPELAASGAEQVLPVGIAAGILSLVGAMLLVFSRRRRPQE